MNHLIGSISLLSHRFRRKPVPTFRRDALLSHRFRRKPVPTFRRNALGERAQFMTRGVTPHRQTRAVLGVDFLAQIH